MLRNNWMLWKKKRWLSQSHATIASTSCVYDFIFQNKQSAFVMFSTKIPTIFDVDKKSQHRQMIYISHYEHSLLPLQVFLFFLSF